MPSLLDVGFELLGYDGPAVNATNATDALVACQIVRLLAERPRSYNELTSQLVSTLCVRSIVMRLRRVHVIHYSQVSKTWFVSSQTTHPGLNWLIGGSRAACAVRP